MQVFCVPLLAVVVGPTKRRARSFEISNVPGISYARARVPERERGLMCARLLRISVIYVARTTILATKVIDAHEQYTRCGEESAEVVLNILGALCDEDDDGAVGDVLYTVRQLYTVAIVRVYVALMAFVRMLAGSVARSIFGDSGLFLGLLVRYTRFAIAARMVIIFLSEKSMLYKKHLWQSISRLCITNAI